MQYKNFSKDLLKKFLLIGIVPTIIVSSLLFGRIYFIFENMSEKSHERILKDIDFYIDGLFKEIDEETSFIQKNFHIINLKRFIKANNEIETLTIFDKNTTQVIELVSDYDVSQKERKQYIQNNNFSLYKNVKQSSFNFIHNSIKNGKTIAYVIPTKNYIFVFDINFTVLESFIKYIKQSVDFIILLVDKHGNYIFNTSDEPYFHENFFTTEYYKKVVQNYKPLEYVEFFNEEQDIDNFMVYFTSQNTGWTLATIEDYDSLDDKVLALLPFVVIFMPFMIFVIIILARKFTYKIVTPLEILIKKMETLSMRTDTQKIEIKNLEYALFRRMIESFNTMQDRIFQREQEVHKLNESLQERVQEEIEKNRKKDQQMLQQSRLAQMGEMISMIAHQWRQPLTAISSACITLSIKAELNKADKQLIMDFSQRISNYAQDLSGTIDDFREFFKTNQEKEKITYTQVVSSVCNIVAISLKNKNIQLIQDLQSDILLETYPNELKQVVLNLIKNAEEALLEREIKNPTITIITHKNQLTIQDNAGGISNDIIDKIFDPYFSTKAQKNGSGLGLYMSKMIIEEHCKGTLSLQNTQDGTTFSITL